MAGTFGGALEARRIDASSGRLSANVRGEVEAEDGVLVIRRIHVSFELRATEAERATIERVHSVFANRCPIYRSLMPTIQITSSFELLTDER